jgi:uncharacterized iron-regulated membrane protein
MNPKTLRQLHRWIGLMFSLSALLASSSGVIHQVMTWTQDPPPKAIPSGPEIPLDSVRIPLAQAVQAVPAATNGIRAVNLRMIAGEPTYVVWTREAKAPAYVSGATGKLVPERDEVFAAEIATRFFGGVTVRKTAFLTAFDSEYLPIFRILPVYRMETGDPAGRRVYVSTMTESVTRFTDEGRQWEANIFSNLHKLAFIPNKMLRDGILVVGTTGIFVLSLSGVVLFFVTRPRVRSANEG